jgi:hypothetical protein
MGEHPNPDKTEERFTFSLDLYLNAGIRPGDFLYCVLCNDLKGAIQRADMYSPLSISLPMRGGVKKRSISTFGKCPSRSMERIR